MNKENVRRTIKTEETRNIKKKESNEETRIIQDK